ncbi:MAG: hypothetical protein KDB21_05460 [Acidimicrobiales bacterium]|nr:hypothetical protein [Acidimicrobiales bacterium]
MTNPDHQTRSRSTFLLGALVGVTALVGSAFVLTSGAGADEAPTVSVSEEAPTEHASGGGSFVVTTGDIGDVIDPAQIDELFAAFDKCLDTRLGSGADTPPTDDEWETAFEACESLLPEDSVVGFVEGSDPALDEAFAEFDRCLAEHGVDLAPEPGFEEELGGEALVVVDSADGVTTAAFGEGDGTVTITSADGRIEVVGSGDVTVDTQDFVIDDEIDAAFAACDGVLPTDGFVTASVAIDPHES